MYVVFMYVCMYVLMYVCMRIRPQAVQVVAPKDEADWETKVVQPSLALANGPVAVLSAGWGRGLAL
eukprot:COSAG01_NODE_13194_length_1621_cov_564.188568_3_plen_65_part_01